MSSSSDHTGARAAIPVATELVLRHGLSEREALVRRANGQGNTAPAPTSRSYRQIILENVFTFIYIIATVWLLAENRALPSRASDLAAAR